MFTVPVHDKGITPSFSGGPRLNGDPRFARMIHPTEQYRERTRDVRLGNYSVLAVSGLLMQFDGCRIGCSMHLSDRMTGDAFEGFSGMSGFEK
jgi:hypothetical protein